MECEQKKCLDKREINEEKGGNCVKCPPYKIADRLKIACEVPSCSDPREYVTEDAECKLCKEY